MTSLMFFKRNFLLAATLLPLSVSAVASEDALKPVAQLCYSRTYTAEELAKSPSQKIQKMEMKISRYAFDTDPFTLTASISVQLRNDQLGGPYEAFASCLNARIKNGKLNFKKHTSALVCGFEEDSGKAIVSVVRSPSAPVGKSPAAPVVGSAVGGTPAASSVVVSVPRSSSLTLEVVDQNEASEDGAGALSITTLGQYTIDGFSAGGRKFRLEQVPCEDAKSQQNANTPSNTEAGLKLKMDDQLRH